MYSNTYNKDRVKKVSVFFLPGEVLYQALSIYDAILKKIGLDMHNFFEYFGRPVMNFYFFVL